MLERSGLKIMNATIKTYPLELPKPRQTSKPCKAVQVGAPLLILTAGTGGFMTAHNTAEALRHWIHYPRIHVEPVVAQNVDTRSPAEHVANIRDVLAVSMSDLASLLSITRPTAYAWLEGQEPKPEALMRIQLLSHTADEIKQMNISRLDKLIHRPIFDGRSLFDMLKANEESADVLASLKEIAEKETQARHKPKGSGKHLRPLIDILSDSSVSIHNERS
ncbi:MAG: hypothetical protein WA902_00775 [Thermosynechococcaceae cyanobacterium]